MNSNQTTQMYEHKVLLALIRRKQLEVSPSSAFPSTYRYSQPAVETMLKIIDFAIHCSQTSKPDTSIAEHKDGSSHLRHPQRFQHNTMDVDDLMSCLPEDLKYFSYGKEIDCVFKAKNGIDPNLNSKNDARNAFMLSLKEQMNSKETKRALQERIQKYESNLKSSKKLLNGLLFHRGELDVVAIEFGLTPNPTTIFQNCRPDDLKDKFHSEHNLQKLKKHIAHLLRNIRHNKILSQIVGYILKFGHGPKKGFYVIAIIFLEVNTDQTYESFIADITTHWHKITMGKGCTYNCNPSKEKYKNLGIGRISQADIEKQKNLLEHIGYLCKTDQYFVFKPLVGYRTLQISQIPKHRSSEGQTQHTKLDFRIPA